MTEQLVAALRAIVGDAHVLTEADLMASYETDWTRRFHGRAALVVRPASTAEVSEVLAACQRHGARLVLQGGNTGLVGGGVPAGGEVVVSLRRLDVIGQFDPTARQVVCGAGVTAAALNNEAREHGLQLGVDLASRDSATIGGMVATNAGGIHVLRHGMMRAQVAGLEAVLAGGQVIDRLSGLARDNSGYDLSGLLAGSEGTLAVITRVRLRLVPTHSHGAVVLLGVSGVAEAARIATAVRSVLPSLNAAEVFLAEGLALVIEHARLAPPLRTNHPAYLLLEATDELDPSVALAQAVDAMAAGYDTAFATDPRERARLWAYRERHTEAINAEGVPHKLDVALPLERLEEFASRVGEVCRAANAQARPILFGHIAEGNLHVNILGLEPEDDGVDNAVLRLVAGLGGSISAEHGIGRAKTRWLHLTRSEADISAMRAVKAAFDPVGMLNPGVIFD